MNDKTIIEEMTVTLVQSVKTIEKLRSQVERSLKLLDTKDRHASELDNYIRSFTEWHKKEEVVKALMWKCISLLFACNVLLVAVIFLEMFKA